MTDTAISDGWADIAAACGFIDEKRLWRMHEEMAQFGAIPGPGVNRQAFSQEDIAARRAMMSWLEPYGFDIFADAIGNLFIRRPGNRPDLPPITTGSHMDSQPSGGRFDGIYGVLAGLEVLFALEAAKIETEFPFEVIAWSNEEGGRFAPGAMGSMIYTGARRLDAVLDTPDGNGVILEDALRQTLEATPDVRQRSLGQPVAAYVEAHIEQGPLLENACKTIGVVAGIQGTRWFNVAVKGESAHAGTTPISVRKDALQATIAVIGKLNSLISDLPEELRFTIGRLDVLPNTPNSVAEEVSFSIDLRHPDGDLLKWVGDEIMRVCSNQTMRCEVSISEKFNQPPCMFVDTVVDAVECAAARLGEDYMRMTSGAFHDALFMHEICPTGMIFVPCEKGISHNPKENAKPDDLAAGARVLLASLIELDRSMTRTEKNP